MPSDVAARLSTVEERWSKWFLSVSTAAVLFKIYTKKAFPLEALLKNKLFPILCFFCCHPKKNNLKNASGPSKITLTP